MFYVLSHLIKWKCFSSVDEVIYNQSPESMFGPNISEQNRIFLPLFHFIISRTSPESSLEDLEQIKFILN